MELHMNSEYNEKMNEVLSDLVFSMYSPKTLWPEEEKNSASKLTLKHFDKFDLDEVEASSVKEFEKLSFISKTGIQHSHRMTKMMAYIISSTAALLSTSSSF